MLHAKLLCVFFGNMDEKVERRRIFRYNSGMIIMVDDTMIIARKIQLITIMWK